MIKILSLEEFENLKNKLIKNKAARIGDKTIDIRVTMATCGIASGSRDTFNAFVQEMEKGNHKDASITQTGCMGYCYAEPTVSVKIPGKDTVVFGNVDAKKVAEIVQIYINNGETVDGVIPINYKVIEEKDSIETDENKQQLKIALRNCSIINPESIEDYIERDGYHAIAKVLFTMSPQGVIEEIKKSGLRGRGGGGFPTGIKWEIAARNHADQKYVVCNADEGDPGAFMDRSILEGDPHSVIEAMAICGYAIGATQGKIYIRAEYPLAIKRLGIAIQHAKKYGLLGKNCFGTNFDFDIELKYGAGSFVCGEETALIHSMEGERGEPTNKPPFPAESGYWQKPTNVNNVETFANVPVIILKGAEWFSSIGTEKSKGTKVFALAGKVNNVGLIEVPMGFTLKDVIYKIGNGIKDGKKFKAVQTGGPSGGCLTADDLDTCIDFDNLIAKGSMMGSGGMIVMDEDDCMPSIAKFYMDFIVEESCGKCTPCREGTKRLCEILGKIVDGKGTPEDLELLKDLSIIVKDASLCGLGQTGPNPILSTMNKFYSEYEAHVKDKVCRAGVCISLCVFNIVKEKCTGCTACRRVCPVNAIAGKLKEVHEINQDICIKCGACFDVCKFKAISKKG